jgi:hypothetical protein
MSQKVKNHKKEYLRTKTTFGVERISKLTDAEIEYYHWLYSDSSDVM